MHYFILLLIAVLSIHPLKSQVNTLEKDLSDSLDWLHKNHIEYPPNFHAKSLSILKKSYATKISGLMGEAHLNLMRWHAYHVPFSIDSVFYHGEKAIKLFRVSGDSLKIGITSSELAFEYIDQNDLERSETLIFDAVNIFEKLNDPVNLGKAYNRMSSIFRSQRDTELAIKYAYASLELSEEYNDYETSALNWLSLLLAYYDSKENIKAIEAGNECINIIEEHGVGDVFTLARAYGFRGDAWSEIGQYQNSLEDNIISYNLVKDHIGSERPAAKTYRTGIGIAYFKQKKYKEALPHLEDASLGYNLMGQGMVPKMEPMYRMLSECYSSINDYDKALEMAEKAHAVNDTLLHNKIRNLENEALIKYETGKKDQAIEEQKTIINQNKRIQWLGSILILVLLFFISTLVYYYRKNKKNAEAIKQKNAENEILLKEIHHRVKNNLQTISSLLSLQSESINDINALNAVQESKNRVASMALIHQKLYQGENLAAIEMKDYFETISSAIKDSFGKRASRIEFEVKMDRIELDVDTAIPIGLITNELITNSIKHAFKAQENGIIKCSLHKEGDALSLIISDNGVGSKEEKDSVAGFGSMLIQLLTTQLRGSMTKLEDAGTQTIIKFPFIQKTAA